jgi:hypothetical protein
MGYTRYWKVERDMTTQEWSRLMRCVEPIQRLAGVDLAGPLGIGRPVVTHGHIAFNGAAQTGEDYETFELNRRDAGGAGSARPSIARMTAWSRRC